MCGLPSRPLEYAIVKKKYSPCFGFCPPIILKNRNRCSPKYIHCFQRMTTKSSSRGLVCLNAPLRVTLIGDQIRPDSNQNAAISPTLQVLLDLRYLATGTFHRVTGALVGVERTTTGKRIRNVIAALVSLCHRFVKMSLLFSFLHL